MIQDICNLTTLESSITWRRFWFRFPTLICNWDTLYFEKLILDVDPSGHLVPLLDLEEAYMQFNHLKIKHYTITHVFLFIFFKYFLWVISFPGTFCVDESARVLVPCWNINILLSLESWLSFFPQQTSLKQLLTNLLDINIKFHPFILSRHNRGTRPLTMCNFLHDIYFLTFLYIFTNLY